MVKFETCRMRFAAFQALKGTLEIGEPLDYCCGPRGNPRFLTFFVPMVVGAPIFPKLIGICVPPLLRAHGLQNIINLETFKWLPIQVPPLATLFNRQVRPLCSSIGNEKWSGMPESNRASLVWKTSTVTKLQIPHGAHPPNRTAILRSSGACMNHHC